MDGVVIFPSRFGVDKSSPLAEVLDWETRNRKTGQWKEPRKKRNERRRTMVVICIGVGRSVSLSHNTFHLFVALDLLRLAFFLDRKSFEIFGTRVGVLSDSLLVCPNRLDVVLDSFESLELSESFEGFPSVVDVTVPLPLDEET